MVIARAGRDIARHAEQAAEALGIMERLRATAERELGLPRRPIFVGYASFCVVAPGAI